jgi:hypothetical protein
MSRKHLLLLFCIIVLMVITLLASSLHDVHFLPGRSLAIRSTSDNPVMLQSPEALADTPLWKILLFWAAFVINLVLFFYLLPPDLRKRIIRQMISLSLGILILLVALRYRILQIPNLNSASTDLTGQAQPGPNSNLADPIFHPPQITPWMTYLISVSIMLGGVLLAWIIYRWQIRSRRRYTSLRALSDIAQSSLDDLAMGRDWGDVIIQAYVRMSEVVSMKRGLQRPEAATPREFAKRLEVAGLPAESINRLTRLFESVRYGGQKSGPSDIHEAMACLTSILNACGEIQ